MFGLKLKKNLTGLLKLTAIIMFLFTFFSAKGAYIIHNVTGNATLVSNGKTVALKKGMTVSPSDVIDIPANAKVEILNDLDSKIYTSVESGKLSVMRIMLDAKQKASDNSANVGDFLTMGKSGEQTDGRIYVEKGMVKRAIAVLQDSELLSALNSIISSAPGCVGVAVVSEVDTITFNNGVQYPMMSVFKLHQALAVADKLERAGTPLDTTILVSSSELDKDTWSPMLKEYGNEGFGISAADLIKYALVSSDNNASNLLFKRFVSPLETDKFVKTFAADTTFQITFSEALMKNDPESSYYNYTSPLSAALLIKQVFTDNLISSTNQDVIKTYLSAVTTGHDRLGAAIEGEEGVLFGHKTGSGYRNNRGELIAYNDVGYFRLPDGRDYSLAVFIRDFNGNEEEASAIIAAISKCVYDHFRK